MNEPVVLILGGYGETGKTLAPMLLQRTSARLILAGRHGDQARKLADQLNRRFPGDRVGSQTLDANRWAEKGDEDRLKGIDLFVQAGPALPPATVRSLAQQAIQANCHWLDVQLTPSQAACLRDLASEIRARNLVFVTQSGFHPGLPALFIRHAASRMDRVESAFVAGFINPRNGFRFTSGVDEMIAMFRDYRARVLRGGTWRDATSGADAMRTFDFAFDLGKHKGFAMTLEEMEELPARVPGLRNTGFYVSGFDTVTNYVVTPMIMLGTRWFPRIPYAFWGRMLCRSHAWFKRAPFGTCIQMEATGMQDGHTETMTLALFHESEYTLTAAPMAILGEQILNRNGVSPGVHFAAHAIEPHTMLDGLQELGITVSESING